jgi:nucleoside-diphosphate-sugar epimerase
MRMLVTGGSGFIGTNLIDAALAQGFEVVNLDVSKPLNESHERMWRSVNVMDAAATAEALRYFRPEAVVHLAARTDTDETAESAYRINIEGTRHVLDAVAGTPSVGRVIVASSQFVFYGERELPAHDSDFRPHTAYGRSKAEMEMLTRRSGLSCTWTIVRPTNVWGPWSLRHTRQFFRALRANVYLHPGRRPCFRSYAYVGNVVRQMLAILSAPKERVHGQVLYLGDAPLNIADWANAFSLKLRGKPIRFVPRWIVRCIAWAGDLISFVTRRPFLLTSSRYRSMTRDYLSPMDRTFDVLGAPPVAMDQAIDETVQWFREYERASSKMLMSGPS